MYSSEKININTYAKTWAPWLVLASVYFFAAQLGLSLAFEHANTSPIWPPTGIAIAALLYFGRKAWPGILLGALVAQAATDIPPAIVLSIAIGNTLEALIASEILLRTGQTYPFAKPRGVTLFVGVVTIACAVGATIGVFSLFLGGAVQKQFSTIWITWWLGDLVGALVVTPFILAWSNSERIKITARIVLAISAIGASTLLLYVLIFTSTFPAIASHSPGAFVILPVAVWSAFRFCEKGSSIFALCTSAVAIVATLDGHGPFIRASINQSLIVLQSFIGLLSVSMLILAASVRERRSVNEQLQGFANTLEKNIAKRTADLRNTNEALSQEMLERESTMSALRTLIGYSAAGPHSHFLDSCVKDIATIYDVDFAFVGVFPSETRDVITTLSVWVKGRGADNFEYRLEGTPCQHVIDQKIELVPTKAAEKYPQDVLLANMGVDSYFGAPLVTPSGTTLGIIAVMDTNPMQLQTWTKPILALYANRIASELERKYSEDERKLAEAVFNSSAQAIAISDNKGNILRVNHAFERITGYTSKELVGQNFRINKSDVHQQAFYREFWDQLINKGTWQGEMWNKNKKGDIYPIWQSAASVYASDGKEILNFVSIFSDTTERKVYQQHIYNLAHYDVLTGLNNRSAFLSHLQVAVSNAQRLKNTLAIIYLDLDHFKLINDASGHGMGDKLLKVVADRLKHLVRENDVVARLGGDEFVILLTNFTASEDIILVAEKTIQTLAGPVVLDGIELVISASLGISSYPQNGNDGQTLLQNADAAMYQAKNKGRNNYQFFTQEMNDQAKERLAIESDLRNAIKNNELVLHYQAQIHVPTNRIIGCEALIRWQRPQRGVVSPLSFIPIAEETGQIRAIGEWVLKEACLQLARWQNAGLDGLRMSVNISSRQFFNQNLIHTVRSAIDEANISADLLELEITESSIMENVEDAINTLDALKKMGTQLAIDDFGTGYSSMSYLKKFPISRLKIDQSFVHDIATDPDDAAIVKATISLCHNLQLAVIAEGVETQEQVTFLQNSGCLEMQGFFFSTPLPSKSFAELVKKNRAGRGSATSVL
ncbi:MAG: diguanylate cyclase (GGDEF)-like protein/PAS domain S-box-containing protein [Lentisphaeria bacterium]|jgi:diguanylate cyclase (GGDEF)-like protein/PAS domain S-box-containing protein